MRWCRQNANAALAALGMVLSATASAQPPPVAALGHLPGDTAIGPAWGGQQDQASARGGSQCLVVWSDYRSQVASGSTGQSQGDIFGIRLDGAGAAIDAVPFVIHAGLGEQRYPDVAWNGENWLVAFRSQDPIGGYFGNRIRAVRVSPQGQVLDATPLVVGESDLPYRLAGQAGQWLVTFNEYHAGGYGTFIAGRRVGGDGQYLDPTPVMLLDWSYGASAPLAGAPGEYLVAGPDWNSPQLIRARRVGLDLAPAGAEFTLPGLSLGTNGAEYYVAWLSNFTNLVGSRVTSAGVVLNPAGTLITPDYSEFHHASVAHDGTNWWVEWGAATTIHTVRIDAAGTVLDPGGGPTLPIVVGGTINQAYGPQLSPRAGGGVHFLWNDSRPSTGYDSNVWCIPVNADNSAAPERCVSTGTAAQVTPDLAGGPDGRVAVAFTSGFAGDQRVLVHRLNASGSALGAEPVEVAPGINMGRAGIAWNGSVYLVVWDEGPGGSSTTQIRGRRMNADGTFVDAAPFDIMPGFAPDVEALGDDFLVASSRFATYPETIYAQARRIDGPTASMPDPSPLILLAGYVSTGPRVRTDGSRWIVAYHSHWTHNSAQSDAVYNVVNADGSFTPASNPTTSSGGAGTPDVAFSGGVYLWVWRSNTLSSANNYISGRIMNANGSFASGEFVIGEAPGRQLRPVAAWDGAAFVVAWEDQRHQASFYDGRTDVYGARVSEAGVVLDPAGFPVAVSPDAVAAPSILGGAGWALVASSRLNLQAGFDSYRVELAGIGAFPGACYPDCDGSGGLSVNDYICFQTKFALGDPYADCDGNGVRNVNDYICFQTRFALGCP